MKLYYDLHIHSVLSMCASDDMTPNNIAGMAVLAGYGVIAVADHNSARNCRAVMKCGEKHGLLVLPALELNTAQEVHVLCLFAELAAAEEFSERVRASLPDMPEKLRGKWRQSVMDENDEVVDEETKYLHAASDISFSDVIETVCGYGGLAVAAHVDRPSNSVVSNLGFYDASMGFSVCEASRECERNALIRQSPALAGMPLITDSDAHDLDRIFDPKYYLSAKRADLSCVLEALSAGKVYEQIP